MQKIILRKVRIAFPNLFEPKTVNGEGVPAYSACFIIDGSDAEQVERVKLAMKAVGEAKWQSKWPLVHKELSAKDRLAMHEGATKAAYDGFDGNFFISARTSNKKPVIVDRDASPLSMLDGKIYAGCFVNASIDLWAQDNNYGKRINAALRGVQFVKEGQPFGDASTSAADDFTAVEVDEDENIPF